MRYLLITDQEAEMWDDVAGVYLETDDKGNVTREVGYNADRRVTHKAPSATRQHEGDGYFYLWDPLPAKDTISVDEFERYWTTGEGMILPEPNAS